MTVDQQTSLLGKVAAYTEILIKDPNSTIFVSLAEIYRKMGLFDDALQILTNGLEKHPDLAAGYVVLARIQCQKGDYQLSCDSFEKALTFDAESLAALVGYARVKILLEHYEDARQILLTARDHSPADPVINKLILSLPETIDDVQAPETDESSGVSPNLEPSPLISATIAELHLKQGMHEEALIMYRQLLEKEPENLEFRRKIREIEKTETGEDATESFAADAVDDILAGESVDVQYDRPATQTCADASLTQVPVSVTEFDDSTVLAELNRLLSNIAKRREHV